MFLATDIEFRSFFDFFYPTLVHFCQRYGGDSDGAKDIAQEAFIRLHERESDFQDEMRAKAFLYETVKNLCLDLVKHQVVREKYLLYQQGLEEGEEAFSREMIREEAFAVLYTAISRLPLQSGKIMEYCLAGHSKREIADLLGVTENTVKTLRQNAYHKLREVFLDIFLRCFKYLNRKS